MKKKMKKKWTLKGKIMLFKMFRRTHTLLYKKNKTLLVILYDDRMIYSYVTPVPIYRPSTDEHVATERVLVFDKRAASSMKREEDVCHD